MNARPHGYADAAWVGPLEHPLLTTNEVHVWRATLEDRGKRVALLCQFLPDDERERAQTFCFQKDRDEFIIARATLRIILGRYLGRTPSELRFRYGARGKPVLIGEGGDVGMCFNVSHSDGLALFAVTRFANVGVDVERIRSSLCYERIASRCFSPEELSALRAMPSGEMRKEAFFACWTRKEAYAKAIGEGLSGRLSRFAVSLAPWAPVELLHIDGNQEDACRWSLYALTVSRGYVAALAVEACDYQIRCFRYPGQDMAESDLHLSSSKPVHIIDGLNYAPSADSSCIFRG